MSRRVCRSGSQDEGSPRASVDNAIKLNEVETNADGRIGKNTTEKSVMAITSLIQLFHSPPKVKHQTYSVVFPEVLLCFLTI